MAGVKDLAHPSPQPDPVPERRSAIPAAPAARPAPPASPVSARRRWAGLAVLALAIMVLAIDMTVLNLTLPAIARDLRPSGTQLLWIVDIYPFAMATLLITMGTLGDRVGRRRTLLVGVVGFGLASLAAALAPGAGVLIAARAAQGVAGATLMPSTLSIIKHMFTDPAELSRAVSAWVSTYALGAIVGPLLGGWLLEHHGWGSVFLINVPVAAALAIVGHLVLPESRSTAPGRFDLVGSALSMVALFGVVGAIKAVTADLALWVPAALAALAAVAATALVAHLNNAPHPFIDVRLLHNRPYAGAVLVNAASTFMLLGVMLYLSQYLQTVTGLSPIRAGLLLMPGMIASMAATVVTGELTRRVDARRLLTVAVAVTGSGVLMHLVEALRVIPAVSSGPGAMWWFGASFVLLGAGTGMIDPVTNIIILGAAPPEHSGTASALSETGYELGGAFGAAVLGSVLVGVYARRMGELDLGFAGPGAAAAAGDVNTAHEVAAALPAAEGARLLELADAAFVTGMGWTAAAGILACAATVAVVRALVPPMTVGEVAAR